ncbi:hypothetical protein QH639_22145 [Lysinibacillus sp. 1 U-2021]|uniref:hypothetical protein n=1 Tax=Lysinibacillus sp. 1 U-2021 TaxID=3039426 RepID=UPI0024815D04|nr:hypothetical protein [Lysinibacillus sp. 1 U-2021]WGT38482.1 hypothetical protein QH639_22145 [Lysinibacillus sp. 1 U-2021]
MTFIYNFNIGGSISILTSDTRQILEVMGHKFKVKDAEKKIFQLSDYLIAGGGGENNIVDFILEELQCLDLKYIDDCLGVMDNISSKVDSIFYSDKNKDMYAQFFLVGFNQYGQSGFVYYNTDSEDKVTSNLLPKGMLRVGAALSSDEVFDAASAKVIQPSLNGLQNTNEFAEKITNYLAEVQKNMYLIDEMSVSDTFCYHILYWDYKENKVRHIADKRKLDVSEVKK